MIQAQTESWKAGREETSKQKIIPRQPMGQWKICKPVVYDIPIAMYDGPKSPTMPPLVALNQVPSLSFLDSQQLSINETLTVKQFHIFPGYYVKSYKP